MNNFEKFQVYIISLWLLFLLIIVIYADIPLCFGGGCVFVGFDKLLTPKNIISLMSLFFLFVGVFFYFNFIRKTEEAKNLPSRVMEVENINYEHLTFLTTYIIPLISFNLESPRNIAALIILLCSIGVIYIKTDKFYANPTLAILGFRLYRVSIKDRTSSIKTLTLIVRDFIDVGDYVKIKSFESSIAYGVKSNGKSNQI